MRRVEKSLCFFALCQCTVFENLWYNKNVYSNCAADSLPEEVIGRMFEKAKRLFFRYKEPFLYLVFGGGTTLVNILAYFICYELLSVENTVSVIIAWVLSVLFAYLTNKFWVFESKAADGRTVLREAAQFFGFRFATGLLDLIIMYLTVDLLLWNGTLMKLLSNILVILLNYIASKLVIFRRKSS